MPAKLLVRSVNTSNTTLSVNSTSVSPVQPITQGTQTPAQQIILAQVIAANGGATLNQPYNPIYVRQYVSQSGVATNPIVSWVRDTADEFSGFAFNFCIAIKCALIRS